jgi:hypothetical protein
MVSHSETTITAGTAKCSDFMFVLYSYRKKHVVVIETPAVFAVIPARPVRRVRARRVKPIPNKKQAIFLFIFSSFLYI